MRSSGSTRLVFCLAGWVAGRLSRAAGRSPVLSVLLMGAVVAAAEVVVAASGLALVPAEVTLAEIRAVVPASVAYDLLLCPFVLYLVVLVSGELAAIAIIPVTPGGTVRARSAAERKSRPLQPRLREAAARTGDGWLGGVHRGHYGTRHPDQGSRAAAPRERSAWLGVGPGTTSRSRRPRG